MPSYKTIAFQREENLYFKTQLNKEFLHIATEFNFSPEVYVHTELEILNSWMNSFISPKAIISQQFLKYFFSRLFIERFLLDQILLFSRIN